MTQMVPFRYVEFYDVPRCIALQYRDKLILLQSAFDDAIDEYPGDYSVYILPQSAEESLRAGSWDFLNHTPMESIGKVRINDVVFDSTKRKELDASILGSLISDDRTL
jgi:hypothetical protein